LRTPDISVLALMVQDAEQPAGAGEVQTDFFKLLSEGGMIAQVVLVILLIFSAISWAMIFYKFWQFSRAERQTKTFLDVFRKSSKFSHHEDRQHHEPGLVAVPLFHGPRPSS
jgi:biopolymer transport protein TolQ